MCDTNDGAYTGWKGWQPIPRPESPGIATAWVDLSHTLNENLPRVPFFPEPRFRRIMSQPEHPLNVTEIQMAVHVGTHLDAPCHFFSDGPALHQIPLERLYGPGMVVRVDKDDYGVITADDLEGAGKAVVAGDIVIIDTGWAQHFGTERYDRHPSLSVDAAEWLVARNVKLVAVDMPTPDLAVNRRPKGFNWPVHHVLLERGVLVSEHVRNLDTLGGGRAEFMFLGLNIEGSDGAPTRVVGRRTN